MRLARIGFTALITLVVTVSTPLLLNQTASSSTSGVLALTTDARKAEAEKLLQQGRKQFQTSQFEAAIHSSQQALTSYQDTGDRVGWGRSLNDLGLALYKKGQLKEAEKTLRDGIQVWESLRIGIDINDANKTSILETQATTYRLLQQVLIAQNKINPALEIAERSRARAFVELLATRSTSDQKIASIITPPTIDQIQQIAKDENATLVEYSVFYDDLNANAQAQAQESELFIWVIQPTGEVTFRSQNLKSLWQGKKTTLSDLVANIRYTLGTTIRYVRGSSQNRPFEQLYKVLIQPIADKLPANPEARVIFIPQQALLMMPFSNLQDASGKYLIEQHTILTSPAIMLLSLTHQQRQRIPESAKERLVVGNPNPMPQDYRSLPAAEKEALAIASLMKTKAITGKEATKATILQRMPTSRIIHMATHGLFNESEGLGSAIALAPTQSDNGWLTAKEILDLKLSAELVVLSACNTGRTRITGDGIVGLSSSMISSGVSSMIASLWSIPDSPTAFLMQEFYRHLQQSPDKAQALRQAMLTTLDKYPNPRDWAAFVLIGEAQ